DHVVVDVAFSHGGDLVASYGWDGIVRLWDPLTGKLHVSTPPHGPLRFSPDDRRLGFFEVANSTGFRRVHLGTPLKSFEAYVCSTEVHVHDLEKTGPPVATGGHANLGFVAISPDGRRVATGAWQGTGVKIWDGRSGQLLHELPVRGSAVVAFSPDGKWLATGT